MTVRALGLAVLSGAAADDCPFSDVSVAQGYVALAYHMGIIKGVSAYNFEPKKEATREQAAAVLLRTYDRLHAAIKVTEAADGSAPSGCVPVSPRAPMEEVYAAAVRAGEGGSVALRAVPLLQKTRAGAVTDTRELTEGELIELLSEGTLRAHRSAQHESSCGYRTEKDGSVTVVWYEKDGAVRPAGHRQCLCAEIKKKGDGFLPSPFAVLRYRYFCIPSVARPGSPETETVNLTPWLLLKRLSQSRKSSAA